MCMHKRATKDGKVRRSSGRKRIQIVIFNDIPDSDSDDKFCKKRDNYGGKMKKK